MMNCIGGLTTGIPGSLKEITIQAIPIIIPLIGKTLINYGIYGMMMGIVFIP